MSRKACLAAALALTAVPAASAAASDQMPAATAPQIGFAEQAAGGDAARGLLSGSITDFNGVESFWVGVRASRRASDGFCHWWSPRLHRLNPATSACQEPDWIPAVIRRSDTGFNWSVKLGGKPPKGHYIVVFRAVDGGGNVSRKLPDGRRRVGIDVGRRRGR